MYLKEIWGMQGKKNNYKIRNKKIGKINIK